jgi:hypothetical protein
VRLVLDACVLFPRALRAILLRYAEAGGFTPLWSARIAEEWARAAGRAQGPAGEAEARGAVERMRARFPAGEIAGWEPFEDAAGLPDPADAHVIAAARAGRADGVLTLNARDFPLRAMGAAGLARLDPDAFLRAEFAPGGAVAVAVAETLAEHGAAADARRFLKKAGLPRLAKAVVADAP